MPRLYPTTSPVAVAATRILSAYLSNHRLSAGDAASLGGRITAVLGSLLGDAAAPAPVSAASPAAKPAVSRQKRPRPRLAEASEHPGRPVGPLSVGPSPVEAEHAVEPELVPDTVPEPVVVAEPQAVAETPELSAEPAGDQRPGKRKRPSRPRSRRGQGRAAEPGTADANLPATPAALDERATETAAGTSPEAALTEDPPAEAEPAAAPRAARRRRVPKDAT